MSIDQYLVPVGNTVHAACSGISAALVVGDGLTSHFWLNILGFSVDSSIRYYVMEEDLGAVAMLLHVLPEVVPSFLVFQSGFVVDWFPAPLPEPGCAVDPTVLLGMVRTRLSVYAQPTTTATQSGHM
jgi:hypothetical protein